MTAKPADGDRWCRKTTFLLLWLGLVPGCAGGNDIASSDSGVASGGTGTGAGGTPMGGSTATGGAIAGGRTGTGGAITGGTSSIGGTGTGGGVPSGGSPASSGGTGGSGTGGASTGGSGIGSGGNTGTGGSIGNCGGKVCNLPGDGSCGPYDYSKITNSNGYNTYIGNQMWGCGNGSCGPETMTACDPGQWSVTSTQAAGNTAVLTYPDVQQLFNDWDGSGFNGGGNLTDTPISGLSALVGSYSENMHENSGTAAQAAYDIWTSSGEIMIWVDTSALRGSGGADKIDTGTIGGLPFTFYVYGGTGGLPIIKLDTNQRSVTIDVLDALHWLQSKGIVANDATLSQVNFGWEICSTGGVAETFDITSYSLTATPK